MIPLKLRKGFTLLELLVVIAIIGILIVALLPTVRGAPAKARDTQRKAMVGNIMKALEVVGADTGAYPANIGCITDLTVAAAKQITDAIGGDALKNQGPTATPVNLCPLNAYYYKKLTDGYVVATEVEVCGSANVVSGTAKAAYDDATKTIVAAYTALNGTPPTSSSGTGICIYQIVQKT